MNKSFEVAPASMFESCYRDRINGRIILNPIEPMPTPEEQELAYLALSASLTDDELDQRQATCHHDRCHEIPQVHGLVRCDACGAVGDAEIVARRQATGDRVEPL
jgi:hypothetical protein